MSVSWPDGTAQLMQGRPQVLMCAEMQRYLLAMQVTPGSTTLPSPLVWVKSTSESVEFSFVKLSR